MFINITHTTLDIDQDQNNDTPNVLYNLSL